MREVVYDTETTGKSAERDKIVEIGAIELIDGQPTGRVFHTLINPECVIPAEVVAVHGITNEKVKDAPVFRDIIPDLIEFFRGANAIAHNSEFDERFIDAELKAADHKESFWSIVADTTDTLRQSRRIWVGKDEQGLSYKHTLDAIVSRCGVDGSDRHLHGALIDSQLLAQCYLVMKRKLVDLGPGLEDDIPRREIKRLDLSHLALPMVSSGDPSPAPPRAMRP
jgi:DNA polymerase-3 subunit epsilon